MKASELVEKLQKLIDEHGDQTVVFPDYTDGSDSFLPIKDISVYDGFGRDVRNRQSSTPTTFTLWD